MKRTALLLILLNCLSGFADAQDMPLNNRVIVTYPDHTVYAEIMTDEFSKQPSDKLTYYWFSLNEIKKAKGGYDAKILHGKYTDYYINKSLKERGEFRKGVKHKEWKSWYANGELKECVTWKHGNRNGKFREFNEQGFVIRQGYYRNDLVHGKVQQYNAAGEPVKIIRYVHGKPLKDKEQAEEKAENPTASGKKIIPSIKPLGSNKKDKPANEPDRNDAKAKDPGKESGKDTIRIRRWFKIFQLQPAKEA